MSQLKSKAFQVLCGAALAAGGAVHSMTAGEPIAPSTTNAGLATAVASRPEKATEYCERRSRVARPVWETADQVHRVKVIRPVWETQWREESHLVRKPVVETAMRNEQYTLYEPVTSCVPQTLEQGEWVDQQVLTPREPVKRLKWIRGGWTVDPQSGMNYWRPPMLRPVLVERPAKVTTQRVWRAKPVIIQTPTTSMVPRVHVRKTPVQQVRFVEERRVRKVPVQVCRLVEQEVVRTVPVTVCRTVYEERIERVPVRPHAPAVSLVAPGGEGSQSPVPVPAVMPPSSRSALDLDEPMPSSISPGVSAPPAGDEPNGRQPAPLVPVSATTLASLRAR